MPNDQEKLITYVIRLIDGHELKKKIPNPYISEICENFKERGGVYIDDTFYFFHALKSIRKQ
jgi:hypothetical protein